MSSERIRGQEVNVIIVLNSVVQATLNCITDFEGEVSFEVISKGYLGEKTNRKDMIFNGAKFNYGLDTYTQDWIPFVQAAQALAKRTAPNNQINISGVFEYPNGDTPSMLLSACSFGPLPIKAGARNQYVNKKFQGECDDVIFTTS
jgi:hypothetical protein